MQSAADEVEDLATLEALDEVKKNFWETFCVSLKRRCIFMELKAPEEIVLLSSGL